MTNFIHFSSFVEYRFIKYVLMFLWISSVFLLYLFLFRFSFFYIYLFPLCSYVSLYKGLQYYWYFSKNQLFVLQILWGCLFFILLISVVSFIISCPWLILYIISYVCSRYFWWTDNLLIWYWYLFMYLVL